MKYKFNMILCKSACKQKFPAEYCDKYCEAVVSLEILDESQEREIPENSHTHKRFPLNPHFKLNSDNVYTQYM